MINGEIEPNSTGTQSQIEFKVFKEEKWKYFLSQNRMDFLFYQILNYFLFVLRILTLLNLEHEWHWILCETKNKAKKVENKIVF